MSRARTPNGRTTPRQLASSGDSCMRPTQANSQQNGAWYDVLDLCKKGFGNKMESLTEEVVSSLKDEFQRGVFAMRKEASDILLNRETPLVQRIVSLSSRIEEVERAVSNLILPDLTPLQSTVEQKLADHQIANERFQLRTDQKLAELSDRISTTGSNTASVLQLLEEQIQSLIANTDSSLKQRQQASSSAGLAEVLDSLKALQEQQETQQQMLDNHISGQVSMVQEELLSINLKQVLDDMGISLQQTNEDFRTVLHEISRIQQAMHIDFVHIEHHDGQQDQKDGHQLSKRDRKKDHHQHQQHDKGDHLQHEVHRHQATDRPEQTNRRASLKELHLISLKAAVEETRNEEPQEENENETPGSPAGPTKFHSLIKNMMLSKAQPRVRCREFSVQTEELNMQTESTQTDPGMFVTADKKKKNERHRPMTGSGADAEQRLSIRDVDKLVKQTREASMKPPYNVFDCYWETGCCQAIAKNTLFDRLATLTVFLNAVWIAVDADYNSASMLIEAHPVFQVAENAFCTIFLLELSIRFGAFQHKLDALRDFWFVFDACLVLMMIFETWIVTAIIQLSLIASEPGTGTLSVLRTLRLVKLLKLSRVAKILRAFPELVIITKGIRYASRSVLIFFGFCVVVVYVFAVAFRQTLEGPTADKYFHSVPGAMNTLLLSSMFPASADIINEVSEDWWMWPIMLLFMLIVGITLMYMLVGVLVEVVGVVSTIEKESLTVQYVSQAFSHRLEELGYDLEIPISKEQFERLLVDHKVAKIVQGVGVDVEILCSMLDIVFEDVEKKGLVGIKYTGLLEVILNMRGSLAATVKDSKESIRIMKSLLFEMQNAIGTKISNEFTELKLDLQDLREDLKELDE